MRDERLGMIIETKGKKVQLLPQTQVNFCANGVVERMNRLCSRVRGVSYLVLVCCEISRLRC